MKGRLALGFLGLSILLAAGAAMTLGSSGETRIRPSFDRLTQAKIAYAERDFARAEELLKDSAERDEKLFLGRVLLARGRLAEARAIFAAAFKEDAKNPEAARGLAASYLALGQADLAVIYAERAANLLKDDPTAWRELGLAQEKKGDVMGALTSFQRSLELDRDQADLNLLVQELLAGKSPFGETAGPGRRGPHDPSAIRAPDPKSLIPRAPDPTRLLPQPDWSKR